MSRLGSAPDRARFSGHDIDGTAGIARIRVGRSPFDCHRVRELLRRGRLLRPQRVRGAQGARADRRAAVRAGQRLGRRPARRRAQNAYLENHSWEEYAAWHLGLTEGATDETKARYAFVYGDFRRVHRTGLIACVYRASEWRHKGSSSPRTTCCSCSTPPPPEDRR